MKRLMLTTYLTQALFRQERSYTKSTRDRLDWKDYKILRHSHRHHDGECSDVFLTSTSNSLPVCLKIIIPSHRFGAIQRHLSLV